MAGGSILGTRVQRKEDPKFLTSGGVYADDVDDPRLAHAAQAVYVRSAVAHGTIESIDVEAALAMPGVLAVHTAESLGLEPVASPFNPGSARTLLASDKVRHVGEPVAVVVAETQQQATDAAEMIFIDYEFLPALIDLEESLASETLIYEAAGSNAVFDTTALGLPENSPADEFFADCEVTITGRFLNQRVAPCPLEVRASAASWDGGRLVQWISSQGAQGAKDAFTAANGGDADAIHLITPDVGGGFGAKIDTYAEELLLGPLAKELGRPVRWRETRSESMMSLGHGRAQLQYVTMGGTRDGKVTHYQLHAIQDAGSFVGMGSILAPFMTRPMASGVYDIANMEVRTTSVVTNTTPTTAYRGAGRPEATAAIERAMDLFALEIGKDPADVRRQNLIAKFLEPHTTAIGQAYDVGDFEVALDKALDTAGYTELRAEQQARRESGADKQLGIGVSVYVEITGGVDPKQEAAKLEVNDDGTATVYTGTSPHGQGHETAWAMLAHDETGIPMDKITLVWGDTDLVPTGGGTMGSRSLQQGGAAVHQGAIELVEKAKQLAAQMFEADEADIVLDKDSAAFHVAGTPAVSKSWAELAVASRQQGDDLTIDTLFVADMATFPFGAHIAVVEVDTGTGQVKHLRQVAVDDAGRVLNPLLLDGQIHGGIAQGTAQALLEEVRYDEDGNPVTSNLADYGMISATELPSFEVVHMETPTFVNPLGAKGIGESGTIGSTPAVQSAVCDALSHVGVTHIDMPATSERVWQAIQAAKP
ncbi:MAG: xanthine dehydrogenase family protein molybdopterin-binding subunit [Ilumatobacter sp.]|nr:xanthine dehydrogenase family protein molybdopterin-binding subunit [bacterium]MDG1265097.1 xanthine dehydrogenase family protein molybdopterin-binding subunit [Ilumatobacter sp.]